MSDHRPVTTTDAGTPAPSDEFSQSVGPNGPLLLQDHYLIQKMAQFNRERVPERVVHAKGGGAYGVFEATEDVSQYTKADMFTKSKRTDMVIRFSTVAGELGFPDTVRDPRGFAMKFYTEQGNSDYPPITVGRFTLNRNPENYFAEIEQTSFEPANFIPGAYTLHAEDDDFTQPRALWENVLDDTGRDHLVSNIAGHAGAPEVTAEIKARVTDCATCTPTSVPGSARS